MQIMQVSKYKYVRVIMTGLWINFLRILDNPVSQELRGNEKLHKGGSVAFRFAGEILHTQIVFQPLVAFK